MVSANMLCQIVHYLLMCISTRGYNNVMAVCTTDHNMIMNVEYAADFRQCWGNYRQLHRCSEITDAVRKTLDALDVVKEVRIGCPRGYHISEQLNAFVKLPTIFSRHSIRNDTGLDMFLKSPDGWELFFAGTLKEFF